MLHLYFLCYAGIAKENPTVMPIIMLHDIQWHQAFKGVSIGKEENTDATKGPHDLPICKSCALLIASVFSSFPIETPLHQ